jgi:hypothetical protein
LPLKDDICAPSRMKLYYCDGWFQVIPFPNYALNSPSNPTAAGRQRQRCRSLPEKLFLFQSVAGAAAARA